MRNKKALQYSIVIFIAIAVLIAGLTLSSDGTLEIINKQSYPLVGGNWTVAFETDGQSDLTISAVKGTEYGKDIEWLDLRCGEDTIDAMFDGSSVTVEDYACSEVSYQDVLVKTVGAHYQEFEFGTTKDIAANTAADVAVAFFSDAGCTTVIDDLSPREVGSTAWARVSWSGSGNDTNQDIWIAVDSYSGICTSGERSGCLVESGGQIASGQCMAIGALPVYVADWATAVTANVENINGESTSVSGTIYVNHAPVVSDISLTPASPTPTSNLSCIATFSDVDSGQTHTATGNWTINGAITPFTNDSCSNSACSVTMLAASLTDGDVINCSMTIEDQYNALDTGISNTVTVTDSAAPAVPTSVLARDIPGDQGGNISITWARSTDDGDNANDVLGYYVLRSTVSDGGYINITNLLAPGTELFYNNVTLENDGIMYYYKIRVCDDSLAENCADSDYSAAAANAQPSMIGLDYTPTRPDTLDNITCMAWAYDYDDTNVSMRYTITVTAFAPGGSDITLSGPAHCVYFGVNITDQYGNYWENATTECFASIDSSLTSLADKVTCSFTATDGFENSTTLATQGYIPINNTPPYASDVHILPQTPNQSSTLSCEYTYNDPDNQQENTSITKYKWYINNEGINDFIEVLGYTDKTLTGIFDKDDAIRCAVQVRDTDPSWIGNPLYDNEYVLSTTTYVRDNAVPQIIDYSVSTTPQIPATVGNPVRFNVSWVDYEDPTDTARIYVCDDFEESEDQSSNGNYSVSFGDMADESAKPVWVYTNQTGQYVYKVAILPYKYIRNNMITYAPSSHVENGDFDYGENMTYFVNESYYDKDLSETYDLGEAIIRENLSAGTPLIYESGIDTIVKGPQIPDGVQLTNFSETNVHMYRDLNSDGFTDNDDIYLLSSNPRLDSEIIAGDRRITIVSQSATDSLSTEFIYDIIVTEVNNIGNTGGVVIARDNDNSLTIGQYNYFIPQYNAQPLPGKYLAIQFCIDEDNNDICDANGDFMNDTVYIRVSWNESGFMVMDHTGDTNYTNPPVQIFYGRSDTPGCKGEEYCSTSNSGENDVYCDYTAEESDLWNNTYRVKVCDEHDACSDYRQGYFYVNHLPIVNRIRINTSDYTGNFTDDRNLLCQAVYTDDQTPTTTYSWYLSRNGSEYVKQDLPNTEFIGDGFTEPGDFWKCSLIVYDGYDYSEETFSEPVLIKGGTPVELHVTSTSANSLSTAPVAVGEQASFTVDWYSIRSNPVKAYICNSSNITATGCVDKTFAQSEFTRVNPIVVNYTTLETDNFTENYWVKLCDDEWNCSGTYPLTGTVDFAINHKPNASKVNITAIDGSTINCSYTFTDPDNHSKGNLTDYIWYRDIGSGFYQMSGDMNQTLTVEAPQNEMYICSVLVYDEFGLADEGYTNSSNVHIFGTLPGQAILYSPQPVVNTTTGLNVIGYYNVTPVNITAHARQDYNISALVNDTTNYNSTYYGSSVTVASFPAGNNFVIVRADDISEFQVNNWIRFSNHELPYFTRYEITAITDLLDETYRVSLDRPLAQAVEGGVTRMFAYNSTYPRGWFNITLPTLFNGSNTVKIRGRTASGYGPYQNMFMYVDLEDPYINTSTVGDFTTGVNPRIVFDITDNYAVNTSTLLVQVINDSHTLNFSVEGSIYNNTNNSINCSGESTSYRCQFTLKLVDNTSYNYSFKVLDRGRNVGTAQKNDYYVNTTIQPLNYVQNGFVDDSGTLHIPAVIATNKTLSAKWENIPLGLIGSYEYKVDEYENNGLDFIRNMINWTSTGLNESVNVSVALRNQKVYKFTVRIRWLDGTTSPEKTSSGIIYFVNDAPTCIGQCLRFIDDEGENISFSAEDRLILAWNFSSEAPVTQYRIVIGTVRYPYPGYNNLLDEIVYAETLDYIGSFSDNETIYSNVRAMNENGIWSNWLDSSIPEITIDKSYPYGGDISYPSGIVSTNITITMDDGYDDVSGIGSRQLYRSVREFVRGSCQGMNIYYPILNVSSGPGQTYTEDIQNGRCYRFKYKITDRAGNWVEYPGSEGYDVMTDTTPPQDFTVSLNNGYFLTSNNLFDISWTPSDDPQSGISHYSYVLQEDGNSIGNWTDITNLSNTTSTHAQIRIDNPRHGSSYKATVTAYSKTYGSTPLFTTIESNSVIYLDNSAPSPVQVISVENQTTPVNGWYLDTTDNDITTAEFIGEPGIVCVASKYYIDYERYDSSKDYLVNCSTPTGLHSNFTCEFNTSLDGNYTYNVVCEDSAGNQQFATESTPVSWTAEVKGPIIDVLSPQENEVVGDIIEFRFNITDISPIISKTYMIVNRTNRSQVFVSGTIINDSLDWNSYSVFNNNTANLTLIAFAMDSYGHASNKTFNFVVDNTRPVIIISMPNFDERYFKEDFLINISIRNNFINATYNITDTNETLIQSNATYLSSETNSFNWSNDFVVTGKPDGRYTLRVYAVDIHGNDQTKNFRFYLDRIPPRFSEVTNVAPPIYNDDNVIISVTWPSEFNRVANTCDLDEVYIEHNANGSAYNYTPTINEYDFTLFIPAYLLQNQETVTWRSYAKDFSGNINFTGYYNFTVENRQPITTSVIDEVIWPTNINYSMNTTEYFHDPDDDNLSYSVDFFMEGIKLLDHLNEAKDTENSGGITHNPTYKSGVSNNSIILASTGENFINDSSFELLNGSGSGYYRWMIIGAPSKTNDSTTGEYGTLVNRNNYYYQDIPISDDMIYSLSANMKSVSGEAYGRLHVNWYADGGFYLGTCLVCGGGDDCSYTPALNESWQRFGASMQPPAFTSYARVFVDAHNSSYIYVDDIQFEEKSYPTAYIGDGTRNESYVIYDIADKYEQSQGTILFWIKPFVEGDLWPSNDTYNPFLDLSSPIDTLKIIQGQDGMNDAKVAGIFLGDRTLVGNNSDWEEYSWHQLAITWEDDNISLYIDGSYINSTNKTMPDSDTMYAGMEKYPIIQGESIEFAESQMDELTLFNYALNSSQIQTTYISKSVSEPMTEINYSYDNITNQLTFFTDGIFVGEYTAEITADDNLASATSNIFRIRATADNNPPIIHDLVNMTVNESDKISFYVNATDADGDPLRYYTDTSTINSTGYFSWTPKNTDIGNNTIQITVCDNSTEINNCTINSFIVTVLLLDTDNDTIPFTIDYLIGELSDINATNPEGYTLPNLSLTLNGSTDLTQQFIGSYHIILMSDGDMITELIYNFSNRTRLFLGNIAVAKQTPASEPSYTYVNGFGTLVNTKSMLIQNLNSTIETLCVKDSENVRNIDISATCNAPDEYLIDCSDNITTGQYTCTNYGTDYRVDGLNHSAVIEIEGCQDKDNDGYGVGSLCHGLDCNDRNSSINPNATDIAYDGIDQDCNGYDNLDADADGYCDLGRAITNQTAQCSSETTGTGTDCDDTLSTVNPGRSEIPGNAIDEDCDGTATPSSSSSGGGSGGSGGGSSTGYVYRDPQCADQIDNDKDGLIDMQDPGCEDEKDDNETDPCFEDWNCTDWSECGAAGTRLRECTDMNECGTSKERPLPFQECTYIEADCHDYIQNQGEEGIDCGGPCEDSCSTCNDGVRNCYQQRDGSILCEESIDCGGPCRSCPSCSDNIKNQGEEDIDCGGPCPKCVEIEEPSASNIVELFWLIIIIMFVAIIGITVYSQESVLVQPKKRKTGQRDEKYFSTVETKETMILYEIARGSPMHEIDQVAISEGIPVEEARKIVILYNYVTSMLNKDFKRSAIASHLKSKGWPKEMITLVFVFLDLSKASKVLVKAIRQWKDVENISDDKINYMLVQKGVPKQVIQYGYILYDDENNSEKFKDEEIQEEQLEIKNEHMQILLELHKGTPIEQIEMQMRHKRIPEGILQRMISLDKTIKESLAAGENSEQLKTRLFTLEYEQEVIDFAVKLVYLEIDVLTDLRNGKPIAVIRHELKQKGWPKEIVDNVMKYRNEHNPAIFNAKTLPGQLFVLNALHKSVPRETIVAVLKSKGYPDNTITVTIALNNYIQDLLRKGNTKMDIEKILAKDSWTDEAIDSVMQYF